MVITWLIIVISLDPESHYLQQNDLFWGLYIYDVFNLITSKTYQFYLDYKFNMVNDQFLSFQ